MLTAAVAVANHFSRVRLCVTPQMAAHQAPPSLGFSRQEYWSGMPLPSPPNFLSEIYLKFTSLNEFIYFINSSVYKFREGNGTPLQYSCLENLMDGGAW